MSFLRRRSNSNSGLGAKLRSLGSLYSVFGLMTGSFACTPKLPEVAQISEQNKGEQRSNDIRKLRELLNGWRTQVDGKKSAEDVEQNFGELLPILNRLLKGGIDTEFLVAYQELSMAIVSMYDPESDNPNGIVAKVDNYLQRNPDTHYDSSLLVLILPRIRFGYRVISGFGFSGIDTTTEDPEKQRVDRVLSRLSQLGQRNSLDYILENWWLYSPRTDADLHNQQGLVLTQIAQN